MGPAATTEVSFHLALYLVYFHLLIIQYQKSRKKKEICEGNSLPMRFLKELYNQFIGKCLQDKPWIFITRTGPKYY
jgi:hypothetical protein